MVPNSSGVLVQVWFSCPQSWVVWEVENPRLPAGFNLEPIFDERRDTAELISLKNGETPIVNFASPEGEKTTRSFCGKCGTSLLYVNEDKLKEGQIRMIVLGLGAFRDYDIEHPYMKPERHFHMDDAVEWVKNWATEGDSTLNGEKLPRHPRANRLKFVSEEKEDSDFEPEEEDAAELKSEEKALAELKLEE